MSTEKYQRFVKKKVTFWRKVDKVIYGLLYPAFFGNMVYDIFMFDENFKAVGVQDVDLCTLVAILAFNLADYFHLYGDIDKVIRFKRRNFFYRFCDAAVPLFFFIAFVTLREGALWWTYFLIGLVPLMFTLYKWQELKTKWNTYPMILLSAISGVLFFLWAPEGKATVTPEDHQNLFYFVAILTGYYLVYVLIIYPYLGREEDWRYNNPEQQATGHNNK